MLKYIFELSGIGITSSVAACHGVSEKWLSGALAYLEFIADLEIHQLMICISHESCSDQTPRTLPTWPDPLHQ